MCVSGRERLLVLSVCSVLVQTMCLGRGGSQNHVASVVYDTQILGVLQVVTKLHPPGQLL